MGGLFGGGGTISQSEQKIGAMRLQTSSFGGVIPIVWGRTRIAGNLIWYGDFTAIPHTTTQSSGGKGGGGVTQSNTSFTYQAAVAIGLCEGPGIGVDGIWAGKAKVEPTTASSGGKSGLGGFSFFGENHTVPSAAPFQVTVAYASQYLGTNFVFDGAIGYLAQVASNPGPGQYSVSNGVYTFNAAQAGAAVSINYSYVRTALQTLGLSLFPGSYPQAPWGYLQTYHAGEALSYQGIAYIAGSAYQLGSDASLPNHSFEVLGGLPYGGGIVDANPADILNDFLSNAHYGAGFPASRIGSLAAYSAYCVANSLFLSPALVEQRAASEVLAQLLEVTNTAPVWSEGVLKVIPFGDSQATGNGVTYTPSVVAVYDLTDDDFLFESGADPVIVTRTPNADAFNQVQVEFIDRANQYNVSVTQAQDQSNIDLYGLRPHDPFKYHEINDAAVARNVAQLRLQRLLYIRNAYEFTLGWKYCLLEPMDIVTLTDAGLGLSLLPVRITEIEEQEDGSLLVKAEDFPLGVAHSAVYPSQAGGGYAINYNVSAGNVNPPVIFEPPDRLAGALELWLAISGGAGYGGCEVWASNDDATYQRVGTTIGSARTGKLTAALAAGADPDTVHTLSVDLTESSGTLTGGTQADADSLNTLCYVDGELVAFETATLTGASRYDLTYLRRGAYGGAAAAHNAGTQFARLDAALFRYPFSADMVGKTLYLKFLSFNPWGTGRQALEDVSSYSYRITGAALNSPLPDVQNVATVYIDGLTQIHWSAVSDFRSPVDYEARIGPSWAAAKVIGRTPLTSMAAVGDGTYWVAAHYASPAGVQAYSANPTEIVIAGSLLVRNVVATFDESATGWTGSCTGAALVSGGNVLLQGTGDMLAVTDALGMTDVLWYGGVAAAGEYDLPAAHAVNVDRVAPCSVMIGYTSYGQSIYDNALTLADVLTSGDILSAALGQKVGIQPQIAVAQADGIYGAWQNFVPGTYNAQYFKARVLLTSSDPQVTALLSGLTFTVDMPDRIDTGTVSVPAGGAAVTYGSPFNGGANGQATPGVQVTIVNAQPGDDVVLTAQAKTGFTVQILNGGAGVIRTINWTSQGY